MSIYYTSKNTVITLGKKIAGGGEGTVYHIKVPLFQEHCAKIYLFTADTSAKDRGDKERKIQYFVTAAPSIYITASHRTQVCWPVELLYEQKDKKGFVGFIMNLAFDQSEQLYHLTMPEHGLTGDWDKYNRSVDLHIARRLMLCTNLAIAVYHVHESKKYVFVDLNPRNILVTHDGKVSIIDTDSMQIRDGQTLFHGPVSTPEYRPPESKAIDPQNSNMPDSWDLFQLAVIFYEILFGLHPYAGTCKPPNDDKNTIYEKIMNGFFVNGAKQPLMQVIPKPHERFEKLPISIQNLFKQAFDAGSIDPKARPSANDWAAVFLKELKHLGSTPVHAPAQNAPQQASVPNGSKPAPAPAQNVPQSALVPVRNGLHPAPTTPNGQLSRPASAPWWKSSTAALIGVLGTIGSIISMVYYALTHGFFL